MVASKLKLILILSVVLRIGAAFYMGNQVIPLPGTFDQVSYHNLALRVLDGHGFTFDRPWWPVTAAGAPTAHWSYLYTMYLMAVYAIFGPYPLIARLIQAVFVGLLQPYLAYQIAGQVFKLTNKGSAEAHPSFIPAAVTQQIPLFAAGITAIYIYFIYYAAALMTESFFILGVMASLLLTMVLANRIAEPEYRNLAIALGLTISITVLLRQLFLLFVPFLFLWLIIFTYKQGLWSRLVSSSSIVVAILILAILPFTIYNYARFDRFVLLNTNAGYVLFWANHPFYGTEFKPASEMGDTYQKLVPPELRQLDEAALDQALLKQGIGFIVDDPQRFIYLSLSRIPEYFKFWLDPDSAMLSNISRVGSFGLFLPFIIYGLLRPLIKVSRLPKFAFSWQSPSLYVVLLYLFIIIYTAIHLLTWSLIRYRLPVDAFLVVFAALALAELGIFAIGFIRPKGQGDNNSLTYPLAVDKS
jgi:hypothetical protein